MEDEEKVGTEEQDDREPNTEPGWTGLTQTETQTVDDDRLKKLLAEAKESGRSEAEEKYKGFQRTVSKRERENAELKKQLEQPNTSSSVGTQELMLEMLKGQQGDEPNPRVAQLESALAVEKQREAQNTAYKKQQAGALDKRSELEQQIIDAGHDPDDEAFEEVFEAWEVANIMDGKFERADRKLARTLKNLKPQETTETQTPDIDKIREEVRRQVMEENGLLKTDTGGPSGQGMTWETIQRAYAQGDVSYDRYAEERRKAGRT